MYASAYKQYFSTCTSITMYMHAYMNDMWIFGTFYVGIIFGDQ